MKKHLLGATIMAAALFSVPAVAQVSFEPGVMFGINSMNLSLNAPDTLVIPSQVLVHQAAKQASPPASFRHRGSGFLSVRSGVVYPQRNSAYSSGNADFQGFNATNSGNLSLSYL